VKQKKLKNKITITIAMIALIAAIGTMTISMNNNAFAEINCDRGSPNYQPFVCNGGATSSRPGQVCGAEGCIANTP
jgi:hypothetical protein